jgi:DNA-binding MarR family transcriptional regulator
MPWKALTHLWKLQRSMREETAPNLEALGLSPFDPLMLHAIDEHSYPTEVVRITGIPAPTVSQILKRLESEGLVVRSLEPSDLRRYRFSVTPKGRTLLKQTQKLLVAAMDRRLERLSPGQRTVFVELLEALAQERKDTP